MNVIGPGLYRGIDYRPGAAPELGRICIGLNLELLQRFHGGLHQLDILSPEGVGVGDIIHAVEKEHVVEGPVAVDVKNPLEIDRRKTRRARGDAR